MPKAKSLKKRGGSCQVNNTISKSPCFDVNVSQYKSPCKHLPLDKDFGSQTGGKKSARKNKKRNLRKNKKSFKKRKQRGGNITLRVRDGSNFKPYMLSGRVYLSDGASQISTPVTGSGFVRSKTYSGEEITIFVDQTESGSIYISVGDSSAVPHAALTMPKYIEDIGQRAGIIK